MSYSKIENHIPISEKYSLTIKEMSEYTNIGVNKISELCRSKDKEKFIIVNGGKVVIRRKAFEEYLENTVYI